MSEKTSITVELIDESYELSLAELCRCCTVQAETIIEMVDEGLLEPRGASPAQWRFAGPALRRVEMTLNLQRDLRVNLPGAVLAIELMDEIRRLHERLQILER